METNSMTFYFTEHERLHVQTLETLEKEKNPHILNHA